MKLHLRPPYEREWQLCRMLLPETFADAASREYLLCLRDEEPRLVAAVSFRRDGDEAKKLRIHVVPGFRRRGVGSYVLASLLGSGLRALDGTVDSLKEPAAASFCERNGFRRVEQLFTVEADLAAMRDYLGRLRARIGRPPGARVVRLPDAPFEAVARLHAAEVAHSELNPWRALLGQTQGLALSPVVMVDDEVAGFMLGEVQGTTAVVHSRVSAPAYRGGWVMIVLLSDALDTGWNAGCRTTRFSYLDSNRDTEKLAQRFQARTVSVVTHFRREATA
ncbi:MAG TPA: GNAT family N-acetyltransferase [Acidobacteriaceae bacterium]|nr:GNAT family N-acetyltransferase [Acidobacteriaceae bacterium]